MVGALRRLAADDSVAKVRSTGSAANTEALFRVSLPRAPMSRRPYDHFLLVRRLGGRKSTGGSSDHVAVIGPRKGGRRLSHSIRFLVSMGANSERKPPAEIIKETHPKQKLVQL